PWQHCLAIAELHYSSSDSRSRTSVHIQGRRSRQSARFEKTTECSRLAYRVDRPARSKFWQRDALLGQFPPTHRSMALYPSARRKRSILPEFLIRAVLHLIPSRPCNPSSHRLAGQRRPPLLQPVSGFDSQLVARLYLSLDGGCELGIGCLSFHP